MNRRALGIASLFAFLGVLLLLLYQRRFEAEASGGERVEVLTATKDIEPGMLITEEMVVARKIPISYVEDRAIKANEKNRLLGLKATTMLRTQQTILWTDILTSGEERKDLSTLIRPGYVALPVRIARETTSVALIKPGDYVDVYGVISNQGSDKSTAALLLQRVLVLATGIDTSPLREVSERGDNTLTLSLLPRDAQLLTLAADRGRLAVAVRRADDTRLFDVPDMPSDLLLTARPKPQSAPRPPSNTGPTELGSRPN